jgi:transposase
LDSILNTVLKKKRGSNAFKRAKKHQENFINWSINHLNLDNVKQINLEEIWNIGYKNRTTIKLFHWQNTLIRDKIESVCEERGIRLIHQSSTYRSQRCSCCGNVRKSNRKGKIYSCKHCGNIMDADLNAAKNHEISLPEIPYDLRSLNLNRRNGFMWKEDGFYDLDGRSLQSLLHK